MKPAPSTREEYIAGLYRVVAAVSAFFTDAASRVLLVKPVYRPDGLWSLPGGGIEEAETPRQALVREIGEELGLVASPGRLLVVDWAPATDRPPVVLFVYDAGVLTETQIAAIRLADGEIGEVGFFDPAQAAPLLTQDARDRLTACVHARDGVAGGDLVAGRSVRMAGRLDGPSSHFSAADGVTGDGPGSRPPRCEHSHD